MIELYDIPIDRKTWSNLLQVISDYCEAEIKNTKRTLNLVDLANRSGDKAVEEFLQWLMNEQAKREKQSLDLLMEVIRIVYLEYYLIRS